MTNQDKRNELKKFERHANFSGNMWSYSSPKQRLVTYREYVEWARMFPGHTEAELHELIYGYVRGGWGSNKKYADRIRVALNRGLLRREKNEKGIYIYFAVEEMKEEKFEIKPNDILCVDGLIGYQNKLFLTLNENGAAGFDGGWVKLNQFDENLEFEDNKKFDLDIRITKVFRAADAYHMGEFLKNYDTDKLDEDWEATPKKATITKEQIREKFGLKENELFVITE